MINNSGRNIGIGNDATLILGLINKKLDALNIQINTVAESIGAITKADFIVDMFDRADGDMGSKWIPFSAAGVGTITSNLASFTGAYIAPLSSDDCTVKTYNDTGIGTVFARLDYIWPNSILPVITNAKIRGVTGLAGPPAHYVSQLYYLSVLMAETIGGTVGDYIPSTLTVSHIGSAMAFDAVESVSDTFNTATLSNNFVGCSMTEATYFKAWIDGVPEPPNVTGHGRYVSGEYVYDYQQ